MRKSFYYLSLLTSLTLVSCSTILNHLPGVYTIDIQQGNIIEQSMVDQLRPNMNKRQVLYIMGSPMLNNVFQKNRWDYLYSNQPSREDRVQKQLSLFFKDDQLVGLEGDFRPGAVPVVKTSGETTVDVPKRDLDKTLWEKITGLFGYDELDATPKSDKTVTKKSSENNLPL
ncbi:MAG: outer membrane protein assembly factor BamE [Methylococcales bacterium]|nr:outer membrane protein assembly factor BamE [Methylococcales bacterium]MDD5631191.1 outer membrane protein assembly factor BamE [Methylococcales bacterium]